MSSGLFDGGGGAGQDPISAVLGMIELAAIVIVGPFLIPGAIGRWRRGRQEAKRLAAALRAAAQIGRSPGRTPGVSWQAILPDELEWITRPHEPGEPARHVAELSERAGLAHVRGNLWRYEPGARGRRHRHRRQEETFVVLAGTLSMYVGEPPERCDVPAGGLIHITPGTPLQSANHGDTDLLVYAHGYPPEDENAELLDPAV